MQTPHEMRTRIVEKALNDSGYRARLIDDPRAAVAAELGVSIPDSLTIRVHEEDAGSAHLVLPPSSKLNEGDLGAVTAGSAEWAESWREFNHIDW